MTQLAIRATQISGLLVLDLPFRGDARGWFKENWQREKMMALGLPDFAPVQHHVAFNGMLGATRGIHAEPWEKLISLMSGRIFAVWVDLREGPTFGRLSSSNSGRILPRSFPAVWATRIRRLNRARRIPTW